MCRLLVRLWSILEDVMTRSTLPRRLEMLEQQAQTRAARRPPVREVIVWLTADAGDGGAATPYTVWTAPGTDATYPRWVDPYHARPTSAAQAEVVA